ncbi:hypothetical protein [Pseudonocardia sp. KRD291]|uniref:hypothetical protein n=1 Tax=Pseudonocardia sp. KRD291 TaxID=2792007 RepID=UPI001C4A713C|nr:hypothetical protein [Pseudonocardia sp. KRD291]MBW0101639.1 hypothetical protein [Pseudonocardia sp. KRD291]
MTTKPYARSTDGRPSASDTQVRAAASFRADHLGSAAPAHGSRAVWFAGGAVAAGAAVATAHGLYEVAVAARVPAGIAWLYPLITDGLALVAYAATSCLPRAGARYAWTIVVLAAGLSGLAQAAYLATDPGGPGASGALLRFGIGAWPAVAAAVTAHLLYLLSTPPPRDHASTAERERATPVDASLSTPPLGTGRALPVPGVHGDRRSTAAAVHDAAARARVSRVHPAAVHARADVRPAASTDLTRDLEPVPSIREAEPSRDGQALGAPSTPLRERATSCAETHRADHGAWPSVRTLAAAADVSEGLAARTLRHLRNQTQDPTATTETNS